MQQGDNFLTKSGICDCFIIFYLCRTCHGQISIILVTSTKQLSVETKLKPEKTGNDNKLTLEIIVVQ